MKINIVICPMKEELEALQKKIPNFAPSAIGPISGFSFKAQGNDYFAFHARIGKANIGFDIGYISSQAEIEEIFVVGVAGGLKADVQPLNVVVGDKIAYYDVDLTCGLENGPYKLGQLGKDEPQYYKTDESLLKEVTGINSTLTILQGTILSGDSFATKNNMTESLLASFDNPLAVDMESGAAAQMAHRLNVPLFVIRGISDNVFTDANNQVFEEMLPMAANRAASVFTHLINKDFTPDVK